MLSSSWINVLKEETLHCQMMYQLACWYTSFGRCHRWNPCLWCELHQTIVIGMKQFNLYKLFDLKIVRNIGWKFIFWYMNFMNSYKCFMVISITSKIYTYGVNFINCWNNQPHEKNSSWYHGYVPPPPLPPILWCNQIGDHSHEDLAKFGCTLDMKVEKFSTPFTFCLLVATCCKNMAPKNTKNWNLANLGHFFMKILCIHQNPIFQVLKMWKFSKRKNVVWDCWRMYLKFKIQIHVF
jgi:hypothetical protein